MKKLAGLLLLASVLFLGGACYDTYNRSVAKEQTATVEEVLCKHKWSTGYSKMWVAYQGKRYIVPIPKGSCGAIRVNSEQVLYYSSLNDTFYCNNEVSYKLPLVGVVAVLLFGFQFKRTE
ncbi:MAG: hypothetical protein WAT74_06660 [Flavobacteriales bacterium]